MNRQSMQSFVAQCAISVMLVAGSAKGDDSVAVSDQTLPRQYTFSWMFAESDSMKPRGGTTSGPEVQLDTRTSEAFAGLQAADLGDRERDRRAILAMAGDYRTSAIRAGISLSAISSSLRPQLPGYAGTLSTNQNESGPADVGLEPHRPIPACIGRRQIFAGRGLRVR